MLALGVPSFPPLPPRPYLQTLGAKVENCLEVMRSTNTRVSVLQEGLQRGRPPFASCGCSARASVVTAILNSSPTMRRAERERRGRRGMWHDVAAISDEHPFLTYRAESTQVKLLIRPLEETCRQLNRASDAHVCVAPDAHCSGWLSSRSRAHSAQDGNRNCRYTLICLGTWFSPPFLFPSPLPLLPPPSGASGEASRQDWPGNRRPQPGFRGAPAGLSLPPLPSGPHRTRARARICTALPFRTKQKQSRSQLAHQRTRHPRYGRW